MAKKIHIVFGAKDGDLVYWISYLKPRTFSGYVRESIRADRNNSYVSIPVPKKKGVRKGSYSTRIYIADDTLIDYLNSLNCQTSKSIKKILRKQIEWNYLKIKQGNVHEEKNPVQQQLESQTELASDNKYQLMLEKMMGKK